MAHFVFRLTFELAVLGGLAVGSVHVVAQQPPLTTGSAVTARYEYLPHPHQAGLGELTLELRDTVTQQPLDYSGKRLAAWLQMSPKTLSDGEVSCSDKVRALASQGIGRRAVVDFNTYSFVTVNSDRTVAFVNPFLRLNNAKLEGIVTLPGDATAVLHNPLAREIWVAMREADSIAIIDTDMRTLKRTVTFAPGSGPQSFALSGRSVWVSFTRRSQWLRFDGSDSSQPAESVDAMPTMQLKTSIDSGSILGLGAQGIALLDTTTHSLKKIALNSSPTAAAWSSLSQRWVIATGDKILHWVDPQRASIAQTVTLADEATRLIVFDTGRYAVAASRNQNTVSIVDLSNASVLQTVSVVPQVNELALSSNFLYAYSAALGQASLLSLADIRTAKANAVNISVGTPLKTIGAESSSGSRLVGSPDGTGMLIASPQDGQVFQYAEGMMAPIGSFSNYKRGASGLVLLNNGFESLGAGRYRTTVRHSKGGPHELVVSGIQPRFASCNALALPEVPDAKREALAAQPQATLLQVANAMGGNMLAVEVRLQDKTSQVPLGSVKDLVLLAFDKRSGWQRRVPMIEHSAGNYRALLSTTGASARFDLLVSSATQDMPFGSGFIGAYQVQKP